MGETRFHPEFYFEDLAYMGILKWIIKKQDGISLTSCMWLRFGQRRALEDIIIKKHGDHLKWESEYLSDH
jgi:hypothetical protein